MRILHTSDWHLGQTLHNVDRRVEHEHFLRWLVSTLREREVDGLIVAGDVFDSSNPTSAAEGMYYEFLAEAGDACPELEIVIVAGNHDSGAGLDAPSRILRKGRVHVVGALPRSGGALDFDRLLVPLHDRQGRHAATVIAMPFLRPQYLGPAAAYDPEVQAAGVRAIYSTACAEALARRDSSHALIATGHAFFAGSTVSPDSERKIQCGNQLALPANMFPVELQYVALGHLHLAQHVGGREEMRYSGSPLPLALGERNYPHQVRLVDFEHGRIVEQHGLRVPRLVEFIRIPDEGSCTLGQVVEVISRLPEPGEYPPFLDIEVSLDGPESQVRQRIDEAIGGRARLLQLRRRDQDAALPASTPLTLGQVTPEDVLKHVFRRSFPEAEPNDELKAAFMTLVEEAQQGELPQ